MSIASKIADTASDKDDALDMAREQKAASIKVDRDDNDSTICFFKDESWLRIGCDGSVSFW